MYVRIYEFDLAHLLSAPGLAWQAALKKTIAKLNLLTDIDTSSGNGRKVLKSIILEKDILGGICMVFIVIWKLITNTKLW